MTDNKHGAPRVLVAAVAGRAGAVEDLAKGIGEDLHAAGFRFVRSVVVKAEPQFIQQLVSNVSNDNEADAIVMLGGAGFGPRDVTCEALDMFFERRIEGFGEAFRRLLFEEFAGGPSAFLARATAGVYNQCLVFALTGPPLAVKRAVQSLIAPVLAEAVDLATGRAHAYQPSVRPRPP
jgi:molybdenum cofactor biosynthesis protein B